MQEHHGISIGSSVVRRITLSTAAKAEELVTEVCATRRPSKQMVLEMDGEMVPLVEYAPAALDKRKSKKNLWSELRIGVVQNDKEVDTLLHLRAQTILESA